MANPKGRPKVENKWAWIVSESGVIPVEVRKHQGVYKTFMYDTEKQRTSFLREVKTPVFDSLEEANKNAPTFEGFNEDYLGVKEGGPRFYESKYGYELSPDMKLSIVEYRFNPASGARKEGYRRYKYNDAGQATLGRLAPGELFESPQQGIDDWNSNYSNGKLIDWQAFDDAQADLAAREPTPEQVDEYYQRDITDDFDINFDKEIEKLTEEQIDNYYQKGITDGLSDEQRAYLSFAPDAELRAEVMGDIDAPESPYLPDARLEEQGYEAGVTDRNTDVFPKDNELIIESPDLYDARLEEQGYEAGVTNRNNPDRADIISDIEMKNNIPKGSISKLGLALDPISEGLEFALKGIGLGSIANWWIRAEAANFLAGLIRGAASGSAVAQLGQSQALMGKEITGDSEAILNSFKTNLGQQMKLSPSLWLENKYSESSLGKGKTPTEQTFGWVKNMFGASE